MTSVGDEQRCHAAVSKTGKNEKHLLLLVHITAFTHCQTGVYITTRAIGGERKASRTIVYELRSYVGMFKSLLTGDWNRIELDVK